VSPSQSWNGAAWNQLAWNATMVIVVSIASPCFVDADAGTLIVTANDPTLDEIDPEAGTVIII